MACIPDLNRSRVSNKRWSLPGINLVARLFTISFSGLIFMAVVSLLIWSVTLRWDVLESLPIVSVHALTSIFSLLSPLVTTLVIGFSTSVIAVFIAVGILEYSVSRGHNRLHWLWWAYLWMPALPLASGLLAWVYFLGRKSWCLARDPWPYVDCTALCHDYCERTLV